MSSSKWQLQRQLSSAKSELSDMKTRKSQVEAIIKSLDSAFDDNVNDISSRLSSCSGYLGNVVGVNEIAATRTSLMRKKENYSDKDLSECRHYLTNEVTRINGRIGSLESEISSLSYRIRTWKEDD